MSVESDFLAVLLADAGLTALVGDRIALSAAPQSSDYPLIVFTTVQTPDRGLDNTVLATQVIHAVQCWGDTAIQADAAADEVLAALLAAPDYVVTNRATAFDPDIDKSATELTVERWVT